MMTMYSKNLDVPADCRVDFTHTNSTDLLNAFSSEISGNHYYTSKLKEIDRSYHNGHRSISAIDGLYTEYDTENSTNFGDNWVYIHALAGNQNFQRYVADFFLYGVYGPANYKAAIYWLKLAITGKDKGVSFMACQEISNIYKTGLGGIAPDPVKAQQWHEMSITK